MTDKELAERDELQTLLNELTSGHRGVVLISKWRKQTGWTVSQVRRFVSDFFPSLKIEKHGRYGYCVFR